MIFVECNPDEILVRFLGYHRKEIEHPGNMPEVVKHARKHSGTVGMIDEDPEGSKPGYLSEFRIARRLEQIILRKHSSNGSVLVVLCPRLEEWLIKAARGTGLKMADFGLPDNPDRLHAELSPSSRIKKVRAKLQPLLEALQKKNSKFLSDLRKALRQS